MPQIDIERYTQPFYFAYSLPDMFNAETAQLQKSFANALAEYGAWQRQKEQTSQTIQLLDKGLSPAEIIFMRTGDKTSKKAAARTKPTMDARRAMKVVDEHLALYGYRPFSEATFPKKARRYYTGRAELAQLVRGSELERIPERIVDEYLGGEEMKQPMVKPEPEMTRGRAAKKADELLDYYRLKPTRVQEFDIGYMQRYNENRAYLNQYVEAVGSATEDVVKSIMRGDRPTIPAKRAEQKREEEVAPGEAAPVKQLTEQTPPAQTPTQQLAKDVEEGRVPLVKGEVVQKPEESMEEFARRQQAERRAAQQQAITEAKGITIDVPIPGQEGQTRKVKLQGAIALAASKLPPEQLDEMSELLYAMTQSNIDRAEMQQFLNIISHPEKVQHLLRIIQDDRTKREAEAAAAAEAAEARGARTPTEAVRTGQAAGGPIAGHAP